MLETIKLALKIRSSIFDDELNVYINSCIYDMKRLGVIESKIVGSDDHIINIIIAYCKYQIDFEQKGERWHNIYDNMLRSIALDSRYK